MIDRAADSSGVDESNRDDDARGDDGIHHRSNDRTTISTGPKWALCANNARIDIGRMTPRFFDGTSKHPASSTSRDLQRCPPPRYVRQDRWMFRDNSSTRTPCPCPPRSRRMRPCRFSREVRYRMEDLRSPGSSTLLMGNALYDGGRMSSARIAESIPLF